MAHKIAICTCYATPLGFSNENESPVAIYIAFLDANGNVNLLQQTPQGVWSAQGILQVSGVASFTGVAAVDNYLIATDPAQGIYVATYTQDGDADLVLGWSAFRLVLPTLVEARLGNPIITNPPHTLGDFSVTLFQDPGSQNWFLACVVSAPIPLPPDMNAGFWCFTWNVTADPSVGGNAQLAMWSAISQFSSGGSPIALTPSIGSSNNGSLVVFGSNANAAVGWFSEDDGATWAPVAGLPANANFAPQMLLTNGAGDQPLQAILLVNGQPVLYFDQTGGGSTWAPYPLNGGNLVPPGVIAAPSFVSVVAAKNPQGVLQLIGLGSFQGQQPLFPYLIWQSQEGNWSLFPTANAGGGLTEWTSFGNTAPVDDPAVDLAVGTGWNNWGQDYLVLQVAYLTQSGRVFTVWQDNVGQWLPYLGQNGAGLP
jgi:hypothetical protein